MLNETVIVTGPLKIRHRLPLLFRNRYNLSTTFYWLYTDNGPRNTGVLPASTGNTARNVRQLGSRSVGRAAGATAVLKLARLCQIAAGGHVAPTPGVILREIDKEP